MTHGPGSETRLRAAVGRYVLVPEWLRQQLVPIECSIHAVVDIREPRDPANKIKE